MSEARDPKAPRRGLLIVDHGTRSAAANQRLADLAEHVAAQRPQWRVLHAHMELADPDFGSSIDRLVADGVDEILVHLHFLGHGFHVRETIPELVARARERHPTLRIELTGPLGEDPRLVDIVLERMDEQIASKDRA